MRGGVTEGGPCNDIVCLNEKVLMVGETSMHAHLPCCGTAEKARWAPNSSLHCCKHR